MKRRSFLSLMGISPLLGEPLWGQESGGPPAQAWGPPTIRSARGEHQRVELSFTPIQGAASYRVRFRPEAGQAQVIDGVSVTDYAIHGLENGTRYWSSVAAVGPQGTTPFSEESEATPTLEMAWNALVEAFSGTNPTRSSCPFWMVHGDESDEDLRQFMEVCHRFGFEGVTLHPYDFQDFLGPGMWHRWRVILEHARKLGLVVWSQEDKNYPAGYAGGLVVSQDPPLGRWEVMLPHRESHHGAKSVALNLDAHVPAKQRLVAVTALGPANRVEDLTDAVSAGRLIWAVPDGDWEVFVVTCWQPGLDDPRPRHPDEVRGETRRYIDPLSPIATDRYIETIFRAYEREIGSEFGGLWKGWFIDEPAFYSSGVALGEYGKGYPWTPDFIARFEQRYGYSPRPLLPLLWVDGGALTPRLRYDYMDFVSSEFNRLFIGKITQFAEARGMQASGHVIELTPSQLGYGTGGNFRTLEALSLGGFDHIFDQWYTPEDDVYWRQPKMASSISHYKQVPLDEAVVEHFAATGWRTGLTEMKAMMDWTTCRGLNRIVPCGLDTRDPPVWEVTPEFWLHGKNPLAPFFRAYQNIANRQTMLIRGGRHVAKALILDTTESAWTSPPGVLGNPSEEPWKVNKALSQAHFDYDNVSYGVFSDPQQCRFEKGRVHLGHEEYEYVVQPVVDAIPAQVLRRALEFYESGGTVILLGPEQRVVSDPGLSMLVYTVRTPVRSADGRHDEEVKDLVARIWGERASGRGRAYLKTYKDIKSFLYSLEAHDVWIDPNLEMLQYYHRRTSGRDLYFFNNEGEALRTTVRLGDAKGVPEFWDPVTGRIDQAACYATVDSEIHLRLDLARFESIFVVLNPSLEAQPHLTWTDADEVLRLANGQIRLKKYSPGSIQFALAKSGGKVETRRLDTPGRPLPRLAIDAGWARTQRPPNGAIYKSRFEWRQDDVRTVELRVADMTQVVRVKLNGEDLGMRFTHPFWFELGRALRPGANELELEHVERPHFTSRLGRIQAVAYYEFRM